MKVKCINVGGWVETKRKTLFGLIPLPNKDCNGPKYGDVLTVEKTNWDEGIKFYNLLEWPTDGEVGWQADQFVVMQETYEAVTFEQIKKEKPISVN